MNQMSKKNRDGIRFSHSHILPECAEVYVQKICYLRFRLIYNMDTVRNKLMTSNMCDSRAVRL